MSKDHSENIKKYVFWATIALLVILSLIIIRPFVVPLISAFILAYLTKPIYNRLTKKLHKSIAALLCIIIVSVIVILPLGVIAGGITKQASSVLQEDNLKNLLAQISSLPVLNNIDINLESISKQATSFIISLITSTLTHIPSIIISLIIILFGMYYILISWDTLAKTLKNYLPFKDKETVSKDIASTTNNLVYGTLFIAGIEFIVAIFGFYISGVKSFLLLPAIIFFFAFIPGLGPTLVWIPMALFYLITKNYSTFIGVIITGIILSTFIDTIFRSKVLGDRTKLNPLIMLIGILGGITLFGVFGFIIGPLILIYTLKLLEEALREA